MTLVNCIDLLNVGSIIYNVLKVVLYIYIYIYAFKLN